jgi:hypothetical protein
MKFFIPLLILSFGLNSVAFGQSSCPLTNSRLTDLRSAASKLAMAITLSPECQSYQANINQANTELKSLAEQIAAVDTTSTTTTAAKPNFSLIASQAVSHLDSINAVFKDQKCGQQLAGFLDYSEAFIDVASGIIPFLALYGGATAAPWVLGPAIGAAGAKTMISFFKNKAVNMRNADQSNAFIKNSCSFYNLNLIKMSLDDMQLNQSPRIEKDITEARETLKKMIKDAPTEPTNDVIARMKTARKDSEKVNFIVSRFNEDPIEACTYMTSYANAEDKDAQSGGLVERSWDVYADTRTEKGFKLDLENKYFISNLNATIAKGDLDLPRCKDLGARWLQKLRTFIDSSLVELNKQVAASDDTKNYQSYMSEKDKQDLEVKTLEGKFKFFNEMMDRGFNIEYSEIIRSHQQVRDALFESYRYLKLLKMKGLAEAWLKVKYEDASTEIDNFDTRKKEVSERLKDIQKLLGPGQKIDVDTVKNFSNRYVKAYSYEHPKLYKSVLVDVCNQLRMTWSSWYNGLIHARAGRDYCVTFNNVINDLDYPEVQNLCFGTTYGKGHKVASLKNLAADITKMRPEADEIARQMKEFSCEQSVDVTKDLLMLPLVTK